MITPEEYCEQFQGARCQLPVKMYCKCGKDISVGYIYLDHESNTVMCKECGVNG